MLQRITDKLAEEIPHGESCYGCPKSDPHLVEGYDGAVYCHLLEEEIENGDKQCGVNDPRCDSPS
jgi:hypothetical protein